MKMDLTTRYLGLDLQNPIVPSASPLSEDIDMICRLEDAGAAAVVMHSLFEEQLNHESHRLDHYLDYGTESFAEALTYFPTAETYHIGPEQYLEKIRLAKERVAIPIIASLNGISTGGWTRFGAEMERAGADAVELNLYYIPTDPALAAERVEERYVEIVRAVRAHISVPLAVKLSPYLSAPANLANRMAGAGADALVLFNRFYQPDLDLEALEVVPHLVLSDSDDLRLPLRWIALLYGRIDLDLAITGGVHTPLDVLKSMMAGANIAMMASELLRHGPDRIRQILQGITTWMDANEYDSIRQMQGSMSQKHVTEPTAFERANYMKVLQSWRPDPAGHLFH